MMMMVRFGPMQSDALISHIGLTVHNMYKCTTNAAILCTNTVISSSSRSIMTDVNIFNSSGKQFPQN